MTAEPTLPGGRRQRAASGYTPRPPAAAGLATSSEMIIAARLLAGASAAAIMPVTLAVITSTFPDEERSHAIGVWSGVAGAGGLLGMFVSALLVDVASWRWLFALPVALVVAALVLAARAVPNSTEHSGEPFDTGGAALSMVFAVAAVFALHEGPERGWSDPLTVAAVVAAVVGLAGFLVWELRHRAPLLDIRLFGDPPGRRLGDAAARLRCSGRHHRGALPALPGRAGLVGAAVDRCAAPDGPDDDADVRARAQAPSVVPAPCALPPADWPP